MPEIRYYRVTQTREVKITANSAIDAALIADHAFDGQPNDDEIVWGKAITDVRTTDITIYEER